ncbi:MAG: YihY/virulence factor BrkB family protein [Oscillospiraceae bacterium]|nr:YihY/virulence factor BrkB family protein [Oscillospiraceae bacterium]
MKAWLRPALGFIRRLLGKDLMGQAAQTAFYLLLAFFPLGLFSVSALSRLQEETLLGLPVTEPGGLLPAELLAMLSSAPAPRQSVWWLLGSVWAASAGVWALMKAVHAAHTGRRLRSVPARLAAVGFTLGFVAVLALSFALTFLGVWWLGTLASWLAVCALLFALYNLSFLPKESRPRPRRCALAAAGAATLWVLATWGFEVYMRFFSRYTELYGSIGAFLGLALWLYLVSLVVILGAETLAA